MDPQQRLVLEVSHDCLLASGMTREAVIGKNMAAIVGISNNDWIQVQSIDIRKISPYTATGLSASIAAARVAFCLGLKGPAFVVDTACSSALVALDSAASNIRRGRASGAVSAASNVIASPATFVSFSKPRMLSPQGRSFTFDASADGYGRGEGAGAVLLAPMSPERQGLFSGDIAVFSEPYHRARAFTPLSNSAIVPNCLFSGDIAVFTEPYHRLFSGDIAVFSEPYHRSLALTQVANSAIVPQLTVLGLFSCDIAVFSEPYHRARAFTPLANSAPLVLAAVKSNLGHLEGSAATPGLLKTIMVLRWGSALSSLHLKSLNPHLDLPEEVPQAFPTENMPLEAQATGGAIRTGSLSSFGFGGTNA
ncbi:unnamed protein product, partial [Polarella glacialis]